jgi:hypothetical protein
LKEEYAFLSKTDHNELFNDDDEWMKKASVVQWFKKNSFLWALSLSLSFRHRSQLELFFLFNEVKLTEISQFFLQGKKCLQTSRLRPHPLIALLNVSGPPPFSRI